MHAKMGRFPSEDSMPLQVWEEHSPLRFIKRDHGPVNIDVLFASRSHGDGEPFDGRGTKLG